MNFVIFERTFKVVPPRKYAIWSRLVNLLQKAEWFTYLEQKQLEEEDNVFEVLKFKGTKL